MDSKIKDKKITELENKIKKLCDAIETHKNHILFVAGVTAHMGSNIQRGCDQPLWDSVNE